MPAVLLGIIRICLAFVCSLDDEEALYERAQVLTCKESRFVAACLQEDRGSPTVHPEHLEVPGE